ncbi:DNA-binding IclR family transcriptional regulator [Arthrobacter sp. V1I7]|uniref:IclR family transcriptional regulator n=1 Tax=Arthrobacter sp. V1I7 TaxID=3042274 RepID=UPI0027845704|nr:IclR family transcriptional regulator [Arthrobacter sp. V1I7]MDQ0823762.1 DNA-binding IclR family transcriptional regulator [Arthrobacter sp. V1I7]
MKGDRLKRILNVLEHLAVDGPQTVTGVSTSLSLPVSSTHDLLKAMVKAGMASLTESGYVIGPGTARLAMKVQAQFSIVNVAGPELKKLVERIGFDIYLAVPTGTQVVYAARFRGRQGINIDIPLGMPLYRHATAVGKLFAAYDREILQALLAAPRAAHTSRTRTDTQEITKDLAAIRKRGISISREEAVVGITGIAVPICSPGGRIVAAAHVSALKGSLAGPRLNEVCSELRKSAATIEQPLTGGTAATPLKRQYSNQPGHPS